jgi:hypothetical protein
VEPAGGGRAQRVKGPADIRLETNLDVIVRVDLRRKATQVDDALVPTRVDPYRIELLELVPHADDHIRLVEAEVHVVVAHEPYGAERVRVVGGEDALTMEGGGNRQAKQLREMTERPRRSAACCAMAGEHDGPAGLVEHRRRPLDLGG